MRAHDDKTALAYSFDEVITASRKTSSSVVISLQRRCLDPGFYVDHIKKWLEYVKPSNVSLIKCIDEYLYSEIALPICLFQSDRFVLSTIYSSNETFRFP